MKQSLIIIVLEYWLLLAGMGIILMVVLFYLKKTITDSAAEKTELLAKIESLKQQLVAQAVASTEKKEADSLNKARIEKAINAKLGTSAWQILNLIYSNPAITNKEIAKEVSLSVEGVSSSLRRMYTSFDIKAANNKRIALIMKAVRLSAEKHAD